MTGRELLNRLSEMSYTDLEKPVVLSIQGSNNWDCEYLNVDEESILLADENYKDTLDGGEEEIES